jgi:hypothetical protein
VLVPRVYGRALRLRFERDERATGRARGVQRRPTPAHDQMPGPAVAIMSSTSNVSTG